MTPSAVAVQSARAREHHLALELAAWTHPFGSKAAAPRRKARAIVSELSPSSVAGTAASRASSQSPSCESSAVSASQAPASVGASATRSSEIATRVGRPKRCEVAGSGAAARGRQVAGGRRRHGPRHSHGAGALTAVDCAVCV